LAISTYVSGNAPKDYVRMIHADLMGITRHSKSPKPPSHSSSKTAAIGKNFPALFRDIARCGISIAGIVTEQQAANSPASMHRRSRV
jgi:hypothetical protein